MESENINTLNGHTNKIIYNIFKNIKTKHCFLKLKNVAEGIQETKEFLIHKILFERAKAVREIVKGFKGKISLIFKTTFKI